MAEAETFQSSKLKLSRNPSSDHRVGPCRNRWSVFELVGTGDESIAPRERLDRSDKRINIQYENAVKPNI